MDWIISFFNLEGGDVALVNLLYQIVRAVFIIVDIALVGTSIYALVKVWPYRPNFDTRTLPKKQGPTLQTLIYQEKWQVILKKFGMGTPEAMRLAIIETDTLVDEALRKMGLAGETMAERLTRLNPDEITSLNQLWRAHRVRNDIVHTSGYTISAEDAARTMEDYKAFLQEIQVLPS